MYDYANFIKTNLIKSAQERSFTVAQVNIFALNYKEGVRISDDDFVEITAATEAVQAEIDAENAAQEAAETTEDTATEETTTDTTTEA